MKKVASSLTVFVLVLSLVFSAGAQQPKKVLWIGYLLLGDPTSESAKFEEIRLALRERGYIEGENIGIVYRYAANRDRLPELAVELVRLKVDIILAAGGVPAIQAAKNATKTIPIVMTGGGGDPVKVGLIESLAHPGGNVTGITLLGGELGGKRLELLKGSHSETRPCRGSLRSGLSVRSTRAERGSDCRACAAVDSSALGGAQWGRFREGIRRAKQGAPGWTLHARQRLANGY
jgi:putative ABC transport system substrate-binding protein